MLQTSERRGSEFKVDILVPVYEPNPAYLREALLSAQAQTLNNWRLFIVDDASTVDVERMISSFLDDPRMHFRKNKHRLGIGGNWNECMKLGDAQYIQFLFQDDVWDSDYLTEMTRALDGYSTAGFASADHKYVSDPGFPLNPAFSEARSQQQHLTPGLHAGRKMLQQWIERELHPNIIGEPSFTMLRRRLVHRVGRFSPTMHQLLDVEYWVRCLCRTDWYRVQQDLGTFRVHPGGASVRNHESGAGIYDRLRCFQRIIHELPRGDLRKTAVKARNSALDVMAVKFLNRARNGEKIPAKGSGSVLTFGLMHPFVTLNALLKAYFGPKNSKAMMKGT